LLARIHRTWELGLAAKDAAGVSLRRGASADQARHRLVERLGKLHGLPQKIGQLLALAELDDSSAYAPLTEGKASLPVAEILALFEASLGRPWQACFQSFEPEGIAASLGQVHRATLHDGCAVAVKVQFPDAAANVNADLQALDWLTLPFGGLRGGFDQAAYHRAIGDGLRRELDYRQEAAALRRFGGLAAGLDWLAVPEVIGDLCADRVLTMTWLDGEPLPAVRQWPTAEREQAARALLRLFLTSAFEWRCLHADPHPGNYRFRRTGRGVQVGLLDFGSVQELDEGRVQALATLIKAARAGGDGETLHAAYVALGFHRDLLQPLAYLLPALTRLLFEPFAVPGPFDPAAWRLSERVEQTLGPFRWNFRIAGPAGLIWVVRAFLGLIRYQQALGVAIDWHALWQEIGAWHATDRPAALPAVSAARSRHLRVRVREAGQTKVELTFPAPAAAHLADLVPEDLEAKLQGRGLDVRRIGAAAEAGGFAAGELFQWTEGAKEVRVWLE
jgi:predicted unusual protein kinase regulating ubiquinone biosynthesis (AarF/ABC1/UbiB family)